MFCPPSFAEQAEELRQSIESKKYDDYFGVKVDRFVDEVFPKLTDDSQKQAAYNVINRVLGKHLEPALTIENINSRVSLTSQVDTFTDEVFPKLTDDSQKQAAVGAINRVLGENLKPALTIENMNAGFIKQNLEIAIYNKYIDKQNKLGAFLDDVQNQANGLPDNNPLKTYKNHSIAYIQEELKKAISKQYTGAQNMLGAFLDDVRNQAGELPDNNPLKTYKILDSVYRSDAYAAIGGLMPDYKVEGNPLADKRFVEAMQAKYGQAEDQFTAFLDAAQRNLPSEFHYPRSFDSRKETPLQKETSQYERNRFGNKNIAENNARRRTESLSEKLKQKFDDWLNYGSGLVSKMDRLEDFNPFMLPSAFLSSTGGSFAYSSGQIAGVVEDFQGKNPSLVKLAAEITQNKDRLIKEMPDKSMLIKMVHEEFMHNIEDNIINRKANKTESELRHFEKQRVKNGEPPNGDTDLNRELANNTINEIKKNLNEYMVHSILSGSHLYDNIYSKYDRRGLDIAYMLVPKDFDFASRMMADIREKNGIVVGQNVSLDDVKAQTFCAKPPELQQLSK